MKKKILMLLLSAVIVSACGGGGGKKESSGNSSDYSNFILSLRPSGDNSASEYLVPKTDLLSGEVSSQGVGNEQQGWNFYYAAGNTLFASGYINNEFASYKLDERKGLKKVNSFLFDNGSFLEMFSHTGSTLLATDLPRNGAHTPRTMYVVDTKTGKLTKKISYKIFNKDTGTRGQGLVGAPTAIEVRGDKLFIAFHKYDDGSPSSSFVTPEIDTAVVAVYDYPLKDNAKPVKIIEDTRTSNIGVNGTVTNMVQLDNGDIYSFSNGSVAAGFTSVQLPTKEEIEKGAPKKEPRGSTKPSGILRIKNNNTDFDKDYFFDVEAATKGKKIFWMDKIGGTKVLARLMTKNADAEKKLWSAYTKNFHTLELVMIDLEKKTITPVKGVPLHQKRYTSPIQVINGKVYLSIETKEANHIYEYDIATNTAKKGAKIMGLTVKGVYNLNN